MAATSVIKVSGYVTDETQTGSRAINLPDFTNTSAPGTDSATISLLTGDNTIGVPNYSASKVARGILIVFDSTSTTTKKLKGAAGDTGIVVRKNGYVLLLFDDVPPTSVIINSSADDSGKMTEVIRF